MDLEKDINKYFPGAIVKQTPDGDYLFSNSKRFEIDKKYCLDPHTFVKKFSNQNFTVFLDKKNKIHFTPTNDQLIKDFLTINSPKTENPKKICVDYSSPNVANELHVGHMRSTNIGQFIVNIFKNIGHDVHGVNHIGDFGTQFGKLIALLYRKRSDFMSRHPDIEDLQNFYIESKTLFETDEQFRKEAYMKTKQLQEGDEDTVLAWKTIVDISRISFNEVYSMLGVNVEEKGESFYKNMLQDIVNELEDAGLVSQKEDPNKNLSLGIKKRKIIECDNGGVIVIQKSDGSFLYSTTDLAAIKYRLIHENFDEIYYVVDKGQEHHFNCIFEIAKKMGWINDNKKVIHVKFGVMTNNDGTRIKSRDGNTISLKSLINDAVVYTKKTMTEQDPDVSEDVIVKTAIGAIKYSDLSVDRIKNVKYEPLKMLSLKGDTVLYQFYSYARICQIIDRVSGFKRPETVTIIVTNGYEKQLMKSSVIFYDVIAKSIDDQSSYHITRYLYKLNTSLSKFYENCRVIHFDGEHIKEIEWNRIIILEKIKQIQKICFNILNIEFVSHI